MATEKLGILLILMIVLGCLSALMLNMAQTSSESVEDENTDTSESTLEEPIEEGRVETVEDILAGQETQNYNEHTEIPSDLVEDFYATAGRVLNISFTISGVLLIISVCLHLVKRMCFSDTGTCVGSREYNVALSETSADEGIEAKERDSEKKIEPYLHRISYRLLNRMTKDDKDKFRRIEICAKAFDSMNLDGGETLSRITNIYMPALLDITERVATAPTKIAVAKLMPYFHRSCDVVREAMEYELRQYQEKATLEAEAQVSALERFSSLKHDTDDKTPLELNL